MKSAILLASSVITTLFENQYGQAPVPANSPCKKG